MHITFIGYKECFSSEVYCNFCVVQTGYLAMESLLSTLQFLCISDWLPSNGIIVKYIVIFVYFRLVT